MGDEEIFFNERFSRDEIILATVFYVENCHKKERLAITRKEEVNLGKQSLSGSKAGILC